MTMSDWLKITKETRWDEISKEERAAKLREMAQSMDWDAYDYTKSPGADPSFPDFTEAQMAAKAPWISKHYNQVANWETCHVIDLNIIGEGAERRCLALYGIPVRWPGKDDGDELSELLDELDRAREEGGETWAEAMADHGLLNDEHYLWLRGRKLGIPEQLTDYETAKSAIVEIEEAIRNDEASQALEKYGLRDPLHFEWFKEQVRKAKGRAWAQAQAVLDESFKALDERFQKNKEALAGELAPYQGISMEAWAAANARLSQGQPLEAILRDLRIERPLWDDVNAEWNARMSRDTTATIATVYGQAFTGAGQGQFGATGQAVSASMQAGFGKSVGGGDPMPFDQWVKIQCHMNAASAQGVDPNAVLAQYKLNAADWGTIGGYWAMKMSSNPMEYLDQYTTLTAKYTQQFAAAKAGSDIEF
jgi:hypothetical protein